MMSGLSFVTFILVAFCCYALSTSKPVKNEATKKQDLAPQHSDQIHSNQHIKAETRHKRSQLDMGGSGSVFGAGAGEYKDLSEFLEELGDNALLQSPVMPQSQEIFDVENMSPLLYYMLLQKLRQVQAQERQLPTRRTPRLGRSIDFQLLDNGNAASSTATGNAAAMARAARDFDVGNVMASDYAAIARQYMPRMMKKSVQFKPRLGKRTQVCD